MGADEHCRHISRRGNRRQRGYKEPHPCELAWLRADNGGMRLSLPQVLSERLRDRPGDRDEAGKAGKAGKAGQVSQVRLGLA